MYPDDLRALVEGALERLSFSTAQPTAGLEEAMRYSLLAGGKRVRPVLTLATARALGAEPERFLPVACAIELIHTYSLIHDDLPAMDDDDLRRGQPTCHKKFGEALAILAGDALQALAFQTLAEGYPAATAAACRRELARAAGAAGMVGGQADDLAWEKSPPTDGSRTVEGLEHLHARKTGALIRASVRLGVLASRAGRELTTRS